MKTSNTIWIIIAVIIIAAGAFGYFSNQPNEEIREDTSQVSDSSDQVANAPTSESVSSNPSTSASTDDVANTEGDGAETTTSQSSQDKTVTYNGREFTPSNITVNVGDTVTFVNESNGSMWVASDVHPTHALYGDTNRATHCADGYSGPEPFDQCSASTEDYSFTFTKAGTWSFHDHINASAVGEVIVQ